MMNVKCRFGCIVFALKCAIILLLVLPIQHGNCQTPEVRNFKKAIYKASSQNWSVNQDSKGNIFVANSIGLLEFDGVTWTHYPSPDGNIIRAVAVDSLDRIFTSGYQELGFWSRNDAGQLAYTSLKEKAQPYFLPNVEFWNIFVVGKKVIFHAFTQILVFENNEVTSLNFQVFTNTFALVNGKKLYNAMNKGIFEIDGTNEKPILIGDEFKGIIIRFILPFGDNQYLIGSAAHGIFLLAEGRLELWSTPLNEYFIKNQINQGCISPDGNILIGTILDGVSLVNKNGELVWKINTENGLQNNTVLGLFVDRDKNIWVALDHGIDCIPMQNHPGYSIREINSVGAIYSAAAYNNQLFLGTNQGLFSNSSAVSNNFQLIPGTQGQVWDLKIIGTDLVAGHNSGTFLVNNNSLQKISDVSGAFCIVEDPMQPGSFFQSTYSNLVKYRHEGSQLKVSRVFYTFNDLIRFIEFDHLGNLWASHFHKGLYQLKINSKRDSIVNVRKFNDHKLFENYDHINVFKVENRVVFTTGHQLLTYNDLDDKIIVYGQLNSWLGKYAAATRIIKANDQRYWFITSDFLGLFHIDGTQGKLIKEFPSELFQDQLIRNFENIIPINTDDAILCLESGIAMLNSPVFPYQKLLMERFPAARQFALSDANGSHLFLPTSSTRITIPFKYNNLSVQLAFPNFSTHKISFQWLLVGLTTEWSPRSESPFIRLERLPAGKYLLKIKATDAWGNESKIYSIPVIIRQPWYWSVLARIIYFLIIAASLFIFRYIIIHRINNREVRKNEEKEKELIRIRNEKLEADVEFKSKELANSTMSIIKRNEFLLDLKQTLINQKSQLGNRFPEKYYTDILKKIDSNISSQDDWKIFENNFEKAHEEFTRNLKARFLDLTPKDLRLCAFLRMNLSSKEIAPLLGISIRGVENHRYRLRQKMNLQHDENLIEMILSI